MASMADTTAHHQRLDPDFSRELLAELYTYARKKHTVAWLLWATLGWLGAHRFYLGREFTGLVMFFTAGGGLIWWVADAFFVGRMVRTHNQRQEEREKAGLPPLELDFMPPLRDAALRRTPGWVEEWNNRGRGQKTLRLLGDVLVLVVAGAFLGWAVGHVEGGIEAAVAVGLLMATTAVGAGPRWIPDVPVAKDLMKWSHRLRLYYYHNEPGSPVALLFRPVTALLWAPFQARSRAEVRMYFEIGAVFAGLFLLIDLVPEILVPAMSANTPVQIGSFLAGRVTELFSTFFLTYGFSAPIGAVLILYLLMRPTHRLPRILCGVTLVAMVAGALGS
jgi:hypothetical protein